MSAKFEVYYARLIGITHDIDVIRNNGFDGVLNLPNGEFILLGYYGGSANFLIMLVSIILG